MATFRCLVSGNTVTFTQQHDIDSMRGHGGYVRVNEQGELVKVQEDTKELPMTPAAPVKRMGRPRKAVTI
tara:strand:- start:202 stop:411 length:210 start_codon:yes stop_codon:yes gene_type:complete